MNKVLLLVHSMESNKIKLYLLKTTRVKNYEYRIFYKNMCQGPFVYTFQI